MSLALCPVASSTTRESMRPEPLTMTPRTSPPVSARPVTRALKRTVPPLLTIERSEVLDHRLQAIGADVGLVQVEDLLRGAGRHQLLQHLAAPGVADQGRQLAVRERPGTALAELDIALSVQLAAVPEGRHLPPPGFHVLSPLQEQRPVAHLGQHQPGEQAGWTHTGNHRRVAPAAPSPAAHSYTSRAQTWTHRGASWRAPGSRGALRQPQYRQ